MFRLFDSMTDLDFFFLRLQQIKNVRLEERNSVIIFDEVQFCPKARQSIKFLVADGRYDYLETGSLISIRKNTQGILIPSEERRIDMFPMDYEEFKNKLRFEIGSILGNVPASLPSLLHEMNESMTVNFFYRCSDPNVGFGLHKDSASFKIYICDTGLFVTLAFWDSDVSDNTIYSKILGDKLSVDMGYVFENLAAQMIRASGRSLYYYTWLQREDLKKHYEVDFLLTMIR